MATKRAKWFLNTSNQGKIGEFKRLFEQHGCDLEVTHFDLKEIDADPITVVAHKASQLGENILVDDTSLAIEGASVGIHVRWLLDHLPDYDGRPALWTALLAYHKGDKVFIYQGCTSGKIVKPRVQGGYGFDPVFLPDGTEKTLAEAKPDEFNARAKAVNALISGDILTIQPFIGKWEGPWQ